MEILITEYNISDKANCLLAFKSNVPKFFTEDEISQFETWLDNLENQRVNDKTFYSSHY